MKDNKRTIGVVFSYEELNTNVLFNAALRNLKNKVSLKVIAYVPIGFSNLFFSADEIVEIPAHLNKFTNYSEVSEYFSEQSNLLRFRVWNKIKYNFFKNYKNLAIKLRLSDQRLVAALKIISTHRQRHFLYNSGVWNWVLSDYKKRVVKNQRWVLFPVQDHLYFSESKLQMKFSTLRSSYHYLFSELYFAISDGIIEEFAFKLCKKELVINSNSIYLRTRNYQNKQQVHNTLKSDVLYLVEEFLAHGINVVNIGSPALSLSNSLSVDYFENYTELSNVLTIDEEIEMLDGPILCRADAGLFVLVACLPLPIFCLSPEWSELFGIKGDLDFLPSNSENEILIHGLTVLEKKGPANP